MKRLLNRLAGPSMLLTLALAAAPLPAAEEGFAELFNGKDLSGWVVEGQKDFQDKDEKRPVWSVEDGMIVCAGKGYGFLRYDKPLSDFVLHVEYRMSKGCNSGLGIRGVKYTGKSATRPSYAGYEIQILDDGGKTPGKGSGGSLYRHVAPKTNAHKPASQWNTIEIECRGPKIRITLNDQVIQDVDQSTVDEIENQPLSGYISLQNHGRRIEFRSVRVKEL